MRAYLLSLILTIITGNELKNGWLAGALADGELDLLLMMAGCLKMLILMADVVGRLLAAVRDNTF